MIPHLKRSRITKTLTDRANSMDYEAAETRLRSVRLAIVLSAKAGVTAAGQAAMLTAVATGMKCFERVALVVEGDLPLLYQVPLGVSVESVARILGAQISRTLPSDVSHVVLVGEGMRPSVFAVRCWWDLWRAGSLPLWDDRACGDSANPLAGILAGALAIREVFAHAIDTPRAGTRAALSSLWEPWERPEQAALGPREFYIPQKLWLIGLGHLGQGFLWSIGLLPTHGSLIVLQDDQMAGPENEATGLITSAENVGQRKTRIAKRWLEAKGWSTALIERRHHGDIMVEVDDPPIVITGLDDPEPRLKIARSGYEYMLDAGVGHGPTDFEAMQIRVMRKGDDPSLLWANPPIPKKIDDVLRLDAYKELAVREGRCGTFTLAQASVAVPFVGAAAGALVIAQAIRLTSMHSSRTILQMELRSPEMTTAGSEVPSPMVNLGGVYVHI